MARRQQRMSRGARTARGAVGASVATVLAAASHALAGGAVSPAAVVATTVFVLPLCVALAGRTGSLWRMSLAVGGSQFFYHWTFSGIGVGASGDLTAFEAFSCGPHAAHVAVFERFVPAVVDAAAADALMWAMHALGAIVTVALLARGEQAALQLLRLIRRAVPLPELFETIVLPRRCSLPGGYDAPAQRFRLTVLSSLTRRGPPLPA